MKIRLSTIEDSAIDGSSVRRLLVSTAILQDQLIRCCCGSGSSPAALKVVFNMAKGKGEKAGTTVVLVIVENQSSRDGTGIVTKVDFSPPLNKGPDYGLYTPGWTVTSSDTVVTPSGEEVEEVREIQHEPFSLASGKATYVAFEIVDGRGQKDVFELTASATSSESDLTGTADPVTITIGKKSE